MENILRLSLVRQNPLHISFTCILIVKRVPCLPSIFFVMILGKDKVVKTLANVSLDVEGNK